MGLFFNRKKKVTDDFEARFWALYTRSLQYKDICALRSAREQREEALRLAEADAGAHPGFLGMAYHNLAILCQHHLSTGLDAAKYARKSLEDPGYYELSERSRSLLHFSTHLESLQLAAFTSTSYDEAIRYIEQGNRIYKGNVFEGMLKEITDYRKHDPRFGAYQRAVSLGYYSRVSAELDKGDYAPALALMEIMLENAEKPEYDYSYEEYVDILDDYTFVTIMMLMKKNQVLLMNRGNFIEELSWITEKPLKKLKEFLPDCEPSDMPKFEAILNAYKTVPGVTV